VEKEIEAKENEEKKQAYSKGETKIEKRKETEG
jgi:hypothetical protein